MANDLIQINTLAWKELELATITPESGFRYINLCSVDKEDTPQARMVVLRHVNQLKRILEIHLRPFWGFAQRRVCSFA
jgi:hypothetical protein